MGVREVCQIAYRLLLSLVKQKTILSRGMGVRDPHSIGGSDYVVVSSSVTTPVIRMLP